MDPLEEARRIVEKYEAPTAKEPPDTSEPGQSFIDAKLQGVEPKGRDWLTIPESVDVLNQVLEKKYPELNKRYDEPTASPLYQAALRGNLIAPKDPVSGMRHVDPKSFRDWLSRYFPRTRLPTL